MSPNKPSFAKLRRLLLDLGFVEGVFEEADFEEKGIGFVHEPSDTFFAFRPYRPQDAVDGSDLAGVRFQLDFKGLLSEEAFIAQLRKASA